MSGFQLPNFTTINPHIPRVGSYKLLELIVLICYLKLFARTSNIVVFVLTDLKLGARSSVSVRHSGTISGND